MAENEDKKVPEGDNKAPGGGANRRNTGNKSDNRQRDGKSSGQSSGQARRKLYLKKKVCRFCVDKSLKLDYKEVETLRRFTTEGGKIIPKRISGNCSKHQRMLANEIKRARAIALLPYVKK